MEVEEIKQTLRELLSGTLSPREKIAKGRQLIEALTDNPRFPNPEPPLEQLTATVDAFERSCRAAEYAEYQAQFSESECLEAERAVIELLKDQPRH